jgi:hypothetical protein
MQARKRQLGAGHLLDSPTMRAQLLDERRVDARSPRAAVHLCVLVQQAMRDECHTGHA